MREKFDRADVRVTILCRTSGTQRLPGLRRQKERCGKWRNAKRRKGLSTLISDLATKKTLQSIRACDPRLLKNRMMQSAMANESFFCELTAEGLKKLEASMPAEEKEEAKKWLEATVAYHFENFKSLDEFFDFFDNVRAYLDTFALVAKNSQKLIRDSRVQD